MLYLGIKHLHITLVAISIILFNFRFWWYKTITKKPLPKLIHKRIPPIIDTLLMATGIYLAYYIKAIPFYNANWLGIKLLCLFLYIIFGIFTMHAESRSKKSFIMYVLAMINALLMIHLAIFKYLF